MINVDTGEVVALHFAGEYLKTNFAVSMLDLAKDSRLVDFGLNFGLNDDSPDVEFGVGVARRF